MLELRYFIPEATSAAAGTPLEPEFLLRALDLFRTASGDEWIVASDYSGQLQLISRDQQDQLPTRVREDLLLQEMITRGPPRSFDVDIADLHLFGLEYVSRDLQTPGSNDPVMLMGTLFGPYQRGKIMATLRGQLAVTRADVLYGLVMSSGYRFHHPGEHSEFRPADSFMHLLLPAADTPEIERGAGLVLAYPCQPLDLKAGASGNVGQVEKLFYHLLSRMQADLIEERGEFAGMTAIPVPSRDLHELELEARGFTIRGDRAVPQPSADASWLRSLGHRLFARGAPLPPEGDIEDYLTITLEMLDRLLTWPSERSRALRRRVKSWQVSWDPTQAEGLTPVRVEGRVSFRGGELATSNRIPGGIIGFDVEDGFAGQHGADMEVTVEYLDRGVGSFRILYDGLDAPYTRGPSTKLTNTEDWITVLVMLHNAWFDNRQKRETDFCIRATGSQLRVRRVVVRRLRTL